MPKTYLSKLTSLNKYETKFLDCLHLCSYNISFPKIHRIYVCNSIKPDSNHVGFCQARDERGALDDTSKGFVLLVANYS